MCAQVAEYDREMSRPRETGLTVTQAKHLAEELRQFLPRYRNATEMARSWGISQSQMSQLLSGTNRGAGVAVLCRLRTHSGLTLDELLGLPPLGPSVDDRIRRAVHEALDKEAARKPASDRPVKLLPPPKERR
jgi:hypothetical protein